MNLKEIIIEELHSSYLLIGDDKAFFTQIETIADNIISKIDWQVIASGVVEFVAGDIHINGESEWEWTGIISNILNEKYIGKNIEIAVREVKEE